MIFQSHESCLNQVLQEISDRYSREKQFLDIGCGDGQRTVLFDGYGRTILGVDRVDWLAKRAKHKIKFKQVDFMKRKLPFRNGSFDLVFSFDVIEHLPQPKLMVREAARVLRKGGVFIISTPNKNRLLSLPLRLLGLRKFPYFPAGATTSLDPYSAHLQEYTVGELTGLLAKEGFRVKALHKVFYGFSGRWGLKHLFSLPLFHNIILECQKQ